MLDAGSWIPSIDHPESSIKKKGTELGELRARKLPSMRMAGGLRGKLGRRPFFFLRFVLFSLNLSFSVYCTGRRHHVLLRVHVTVPANNHMLLSDCIRQRG